ncbi:hypothetical protein RYX36_004838 [Vicia faba]
MATQTIKRKPLFVKADELKPGTSGHTLTVKVVSSSSVKTVSSRGGRSSVIASRSGQLGDDSDSDFKDSSSDGSSDCEPARGYREQRNLPHLSDDLSNWMGRLSVRNQHTLLQDGFSSDDGESINSQGYLLFEYFERDTPYGREPLADKVYKECSLLYHHIQSRWMVSQKYLYLFLVLPHTSSRDPCGLQVVDTSANYPTLFYRMLINGYDCFRSVTHISCFSAVDCVNAVHACNP